MIQNKLLFDGPSPSSGFNLGEVVADVTEREANRPVAQDSTHPDGPLAPATSESVEVVSTGTESEAVRLLAARIPQELFDDILFYVNVDRISQRKWLGGEYLKRNRGEPSPRDILPDLKRCSLVCLFWANRCRQHMFYDRTLEIKSYRDAEIFRRYVVGGCPRLIPVHQLVGHISVIQNYSKIRALYGSGRKTSFLHLLYLPAIQDKLKVISFEGPVPAGINPAKLDTPHWDIPPSVVVPSSFLRNNIEIRNVHFPSFSHVIKCIRHFLCAAYIMFDTITWDAHRVPLILPHASNTIVCQRRPRSLRICITGARGCTDAVHLALTALMLNPNCPLHRLSDEERVWMTRFMTLRWGDKKDTYVGIDFNVSEQRTTMCAGPFHFVFEEAPATDRPGSVLSMVGMHAYIHSLSVNFDALANHARTHPTIRALVLLFFSFDRLQESVKSFVQVLTLAAETIELVLAYQERKQRRAVRVDPVTLEPNGRVDTWIGEQSELYWGEDLSSQMLQRQLKKKKWMSAH